jgi:predicted ATPase
MTQLVEACLSCGSSELSSRSSAAWDPDVAKYRCLECGHEADRATVRVARDPRAEGWVGSDENQRAGSVEHRLRMMDRGELP